MIDDEHSTKLIEAKIRFAEEHRFMASKKRDLTGRLPPGQSKVNGLPVLDLGVHPEISHSEWMLVIDGEVENPCAINWEQFSNLEQADVVTDIHCVTSWSSFDNRWKGVSLSTLVDLVGLRDGATHAMLHGHDGYTTNVPIEDLLQGNCLIATSWNGDSLSTSHGGPARLVIPHLYFWKSAKWIRRIEFMRADAPGYWEQRGYHNDGDPWQEQRYGKPTPRPEPVIEAINTAEHCEIPSPSLFSRLKAWVNYHFFPE